MALSSTTLKGELLALPDTLVEAEAIENWSIAYSRYMIESQCVGVSPAIPQWPVPGSPTPVEATFIAAELAMRAAMVGLSVPGQGALKLVSGIAAYWVALAPSAALIWVTVPPLTVIALPPIGVVGQPGFIAALTAAFVANIAGALDKDPATEVVANIIHTQSQGGIATQLTVPSPTPQPIT